MKSPQPTAFNIARQSIEQVSNIPTEPTAKNPSAVGLGRFGGIKCGKLWPSCFLHQKGRKSRKKQQNLGSLQKAIKVI
ncbi:MAG: hypothetical protein ABSF34_08040 [Verrucomicrobiota bacterium]